MGVNVTFTVQLAPAAKVEGDIGQLTFCAVKLALVAMLEMRNAPVVALCTVIGVAALIPPGVAVGPNVAVWGSAVICGCTPAPESVAVRLTPGVAAIAMLPARVPVVVGVNTTFKTHVPFAATCPAQVLVCV